MFRLTIQLPHEERHVDVPASRAQRLLTDVLRGMQLPLNTRCGQRGLCDGCMIELVQGNLQCAATGELLAASAEAQPLRGCEVSLPERGEAVIHVPSRSLLAHQPQVVTSFRLKVPGRTIRCGRAFASRRTNWLPRLPFASHSMRRLHRSSNAHCL